MAHTEPRFHVPAPHVRPGDTPDFSHIDIPPAGEAKRPDPSVPGMETRDLALGLVRVLDHNHQDFNSLLNAGQGQNPAPT